MSGKEIKQTADKFIRKEIKKERNRQRENQYLNLTANVLNMNRLGINYLEGGIINIEINLSIGTEIYLLLIDNKIQIEPIKKKKNYSWMIY